MSKNKIKCCLIVGHSEKAQGAKNPQTGITEYQFNEMVAESIESVFALRPEQDIELIIFRRKNGYSSLPTEVNKLNPDFIVSMHCNAFNRKAEGKEFLHSGSKNGTKLAYAMNITSPSFLNRGIKSRTIKQRGGYLLHKTKAPCVICEPFFIDNNAQFKVARSKFLLVVDGYCDGIVEASKLF